VLTQFHRVNKGAKVNNALWLKREWANKLMQHIKCLFDLAIAVPSVIILSPLLALIGIMVRMKTGTPVLFRQVRPGLHGKPFIIYKFRTMTYEGDEEENLLPDRERLIVILITPKEFGADRETVRIDLESKNIEARPVWKPMHMQAVFDCGSGLPAGRQAGFRG
jgi:hypothetical protein